MAGEKTEKATPRRKQEERKKGNIFQSHELVSVFALAVTFFSLKMLGPLIVDTLEDAFERFIRLSAQMKTITHSDLRNLLVQGILVFLQAALPMLLIAVAVSVVITIAQTKMLVSFESLKPKFSKLNPLSGLKRMISIRGLVELVKALIKIGVLSYIVYSQFSERLMLFPRLMDMEPLQAVSFLGDFIITLVSTVTAIFIFLAVGDYVYQWWDSEKKLRMSKDEVKEEYKQTEGDPQIKGKIKQKQREMSQARMMQEVPNADVVIRNPTHYAVAIGYDPEKNTAPVVLAKGADFIALRIVKIAEENNVMVVENKPLARGLYETVDISREIPEQFYHAAAEVLAFVYSLKKKGVNI